MLAANIRTCGLNHRDGASGNVDCACFTSGVYPNHPLKNEYSIKVNQWLQGNGDYFIPGNQSLLVIEAKQADLARGFVQLGAELVALDQWMSSSNPVIYGAITTGDAWKFGCFDRIEKKLTQDIRLYTIPSDLHALAKILTGIIKGNGVAETLP